MQSPIRVINMKFDIRYMLGKDEIGRISDASSMPDVFTIVAINQDLYRVKDLKIVDGTLDIITVDVLVEPTPKVSKYLSYQ
jgi:hypothetical protein